MNNLLETNHSNTIIRNSLLATEKDVFKEILENRTVVSPGNKVKWSLGEKEARSFILSWKGEGLNMLPCGTPLLNLCILDLVPAISIYWNRFDK